MWMVPAQEFAAALVSGANAIMNGTTSVHLIPMLLLSQDVPRPSLPGGRVVDVVHVVWTAAVPGRVADLGMNV